MELSLVWIIYMIEVLSSDGGATALALCVTTILCAAGGIAYAGGTEKDGGKEFARTVKAILTSKIYTFFFCSFFLYGWLMPSKDTAYKMLAAYGVTELAADEDVRRVAGKSLKLIEDTLDKYTEKKE